MDKKSSRKRPWLSHPPSKVPVTARRIAECPEAATPGGHAPATHFSQRKQRLVCATCAAVERITDLRMLARAGDEMPAIAAWCESELWRIRMAFSADLPPPLREDES